jgi:hypothetical protein
MCGFPVSFENMARRALAFAMHAGTGQARPRSAHEVINRHSSGRKSLAELENGEKNASFSIARGFQDGTM